MDELDNLRELAIAVTAPDADFDCEEAIGDSFEDRERYYSELAAKLRALAREASFPAARRILIEVAKRFDQEVAGQRMPVATEELGCQRVGDANGFQFPHTRNRRRPGRPPITAPPID